MTEHWNRLNQLLEFTDELNIKKCYSENGSLESLDVRFDIGDFEISLGIFVDEPVDRTMYYSIWSNITNAFLIFGEITFDELIDSIDRAKKVIKNMEEEKYEWRTF
jgi:hypothetical protein